METIREWHLARGFTDCGYHWVIYPTGDTKPGRPENEQGSHVKGANEGNIGICLNGRDKFTTAQFDALRVLLDRLFAEYDIPAGNLFCHYQFPSAVAQGKTCPSIKAYDLHSWYFGEDEAAIKKYLLNS